MAQDQSAEQRKEERKRALQERREEAKKTLEEQRQERAEATAEAVKRMESTQPTPTQEENDLAKLGVAVEEKEDDGSGETIIERRIVANQPLGPGGYETRSVRAKRDEQSAERERERQRREQLPRPTHEG